MHAVQEPSRAGCFQGGLMEDHVTRIAGIPVQVLGYLIGLCILALLGFFDKR